MRVSRADRPARGRGTTASGRGGPTPVGHRAAGSSRGGQPLAALFGGLPTAQAEGLGDLVPGRTGLPGLVDQVEFGVVKPFPDAGDVGESVERVEHPSTLH
ncbi:hypothetical protein [Micromonospora sp. CP22]|uniref:hypothetical protein n=1 Tax=Micromonospora sp. CP22 TaxID=2580517 RepID=UPI0012BBB9AB